MFVSTFTYESAECGCRLFGCYEALNGGELSEALEDFTGGVSETVDLNNAPFLTDEAEYDRFYEWLVRAVDNGSVMCAAITVSCALVLVNTNTRPFFMLCAL